LLDAGKGVPLSRGTAEWLAFTSCVCSWQIAGKCDRV